MDERIAKLPTWAQQRIRKLENDYEHLKKETETVQRGESSVYYYNSPDMTKHYLPERVTVVFGKIEVSYRDDRIEVMALRGGLVILPKVTNYVHVKTDR